MGNHAKQALVAAIAVTGLDTLLDTRLLTALRGGRRDVDDLHNRVRCCWR